MSKKQLTPAKHQLTLPGFRMTTNALTPNKGLTEAQWNEAGVILSRISGSVNWWIGDWLLAGEGAGYLPRGKLQQAREKFDIEVSTAKNAAMVARGFERSRRRDLLTWSHHLEVCALDEETQETLLDEAAEKNWSRNDTRREVRRLRFRAASENGKRCAKTAPQNVFCADWRRVAEKLPDNSVQLIFTDPPYHADFAEQYLELAECATRVLGKEGSLVAYFSNVMFPRLAAEMGEVEGLRFYWSCACVHSGPRGMKPTTGIRNCWKPLGWFVKGFDRFDRSDIMVDAIISRPEKDFHEWQQSELEASYFIEKLTTEEGLVFDPYCGSGTTSVAAKQLGRSWITCDVDKQAVKAARQRIAKCQV